MESSVGFHLYKVASNASNVLALTMAAMTALQIIQQGPDGSHWSQGWKMAERGIAEKDTQHPLFPQVIQGIGIAAKLGHVSIFASSVTLKWSKMRSFEQQIKDTKRFPFAGILWEKVMQLEKGHQEMLGKSEQEPGGSSSAAVPEASASQPAPGIVVCCACQKPRPKADFAARQLRNSVVKGRKCLFCTSHEGKHEEDK